MGQLRAGIQASDDALPIATWVFQAHVYVNIARFHCGSDP
jgi:hypothetical protein